MVTESNEKKYKKTVFLQTRKSFDQAVQRAKRHHWQNKQEELLNLNGDSASFWTAIGKIGIAEERKTVIPFEVYDNDGNITNEYDTVMNRWKNDFRDLFNPEEVKAGNKALDAEVRLFMDFDIIANPLEIDELDDAISMQEIIDVIGKAKTGKACGVDMIPMEVLHGENVILILYCIFNVCYQTGIFPSEWSKGIINPIPKSSTVDSRNPLQYRGIMITSSVYKLFCSILNQRLCKWMDSNKILTDAQNGFRKSRSTVDQLCTLTSIIETRKSYRQSTFVAFVDFRKAYDVIDRGYLFYKLLSTGVSAKFVHILKKLYENCKSCGYMSDWFPVERGLKQGCVLSPAAIFNLFINDLALKFETINKGINIDGQYLNILLYADDLVLLADSEESLQVLLQHLHQWCLTWKIQVNCDKSNVVHFRTPKAPRTDFTFRIGPDIIKIDRKYKYLGLVLNEHLDYNETVENVTQCANRAFGAVVAKSKHMGGLPFKVYVKLLDSMVWPVVEYAAAIWGSKDYSCVNALHNRMCRYYLGVGIYTPNAAVRGDMGMCVPTERQWMTVLRQWCHLETMDDSRINKKVFVWAKKHSDTKANWCARVRKKFEGIIGICQNENFDSQSVFQQVKEMLQHERDEDWKRILQRENAIRGTGNNKLRLYRQHKLVFKN